jgi:hypothetical protein
MPPRPRKRLLLFVGLPVLLVGLGLTCWLLLFPTDPLLFQGDLYRKLEARHGKEQLIALQARRFHRGPGICWRYHNGGGTAEARDEVANKLLDSGVAQRATGDLYGLVEKWARDLDDKHHRASQAGERMLMVAEAVSGLDRVVFSLNEGRIRRGLENFGRENTTKREAMAARSWARLSPAQRKLVRALWEQHPEVMTPLGLFGMEFWFKKNITARRMDKVVEALKAWIAEHGKPPKDLKALKLEQILLYDSFGLPLRYRTAQSDVELRATGFDGFPSKDDIVREIRMP